MSRITQQKQIEYFIKYAGSCLDIWNSIVGQQVHYGAELRTVVGIKKIDDCIFVDVGSAEGQRLGRFLGFGKGGGFGDYHFSKVFTHLTLPREIENELEKRYWNFIKEDLICEIRNLVSRPSIDQSTYNTFNEIYDRLMRANRTRQLSEQDIQKINEYQQKLTDKMICEIRNLALHTSIDQSTSNTFYEIYDRLMTMNKKRKLPEEIIQEINRYQQKLTDRKRFTNLSEKAMNPNVRAHFSLPELDEDDIQLVGKWDPLLNNLDRTSLIELTETDNKAKWESGRLLSARSAEKIARCFYRNYGKEVKDVSITQIEKNNNFDWKDYDLDVDGLHVDIKNSRQSQKSKDRYTEYCIPSFKCSRRTNQEVRIAGVFSPYLSTRQ